MWQFLLLPVCLAIHLDPRTIRDTSERWINVRLNHFMAVDTTTFPLRYYYNDALQGSNIVIYLGGTTEISPTPIQGGLAFDLARELNAGLFYPEHRFYGQSRPSESTSTSSLRFLSVDQVLGDLAQFIQHIKSDEFEGGFYKDGKVALVGCSYAATLATWMRFAYPHLIDAVYSDSGPLVAKQDFSEYLETVTDSLTQLGSQECVDTVAEGMDALRALLTDSGVAQVSQLFNTCAPLQNSPLDVTTLYWFGVIEPFVKAAENPSDIENACNTLTDETVADPLQRLVNWLTSRRNTQSCFEARYSEVVAQYTDTNYTSIHTTDRLKAYQQCVEFGWFQTTAGNDQVFLSTVPLGYFQQFCRDLFDSVITEESISAGVARTNTLFGGGWVPDRVVSLLGSRDPWATLGANVSVVRNLAPVYAIENGGHCSALGSISEDNTELERKKREAFSDMYWLMTGQEYSLSSATSLVAPALVIVLAMALV